MADSLDDLIKAVNDPEALAATAKKTTQEWSIDNLIETVNDPKALAAQAMDAAHQWSVVDNILRRASTIKDELETGKACDVDPKAVYLAKAYSDLALKQVLDNGVPLRPEFYEDILELGNLIGARPVNERVAISDIKPG